MNAKRIYGFTKMGTFFTILGVILLIAGGVVGTFFFMKNAQVNDATAFMNTFTNELEAGNTDTTFKSLDDSIKDDESVAYYSWLFWSSTFNENDIIIESTPAAVTFLDDSIGSILSNKGTILFTFNTSVDSKINLTVTKKGSSWAVVEYAAVD
jgi:hypothetical protein